MISPWAPPKFASMTSDKVLAATVPRPEPIMRLLVVSVAESAEIEVSRELRGCQRRPVPFSMSAVSRPRIWAMLFMFWTNCSSERVWLFGSLSSIRVSLASDQTA